MLVGNEGQLEAEVFWIFGDSLFIFWLHDRRLFIQENRSCHERERERERERDETEKCLKKVCLTVQLKRETAIERNGHTHPHTHKERENERERK
jgi:hypothetical protein